MNKEHGILVNEGMGGFLNPPGHPEHTHSIEFDLLRRKENRGRCSLSSAVESDWLDGETRGVARKALASWNKPALDSEPVKDWIRNVLGYFAGCYQGANGSWNASDLTIDKHRDALAHQDTHAGVHLIREYYPEYIASAEDFAGAYWGTKRV